jgi:hypothetical protein
LQCCRLMTGPSFRVRLDRSRLSASRFLPHLAGSFSLMIHTPSSLPLKFCIALPEPTSMSDFPQSTGISYQLSCCRSFLAFIDINRAAVLYCVLRYGEGAFDQGLECRQSEVYHSEWLRCNHIPIMDKWRSRLVGHEKPRCREPVTRITSGYILCLVVNRVFGVVAAGAKDNGVIVSLSCDGRFLWSTRSR